MSPSPNHARASTLSSNILNVSCLSMPTVLTGIASSPPPLVLAGPAVTSPLLPLPRSILAASLTSADASQLPVASSTSNQHRSICFTDSTSSWCSGSHRRRCLPLAPLPTSQAPTAQHAAVHVARCRRPVADQEEQAVNGRPQAAAVD